MSDEIKSRGYIQERDRERERDRETESLKTVE